MMEIITTVNGLQLVPTASIQATTGYNTVDHNLEISVRNSDVFSFLGTFGEQFGNKEIISFQRGLKEGFSWFRLSKLEAVKKKDDERVFQNCGKFK